MRSVLQHNAVVIAVGGALVVLAVVGGFAVTLSVLSIVVSEMGWRTLVIGGSRVECEVVGGKDAYRYSGDVTRIEVTGPAVLQFDDND